MHAADLLSKRADLTPDREALVELATGRRYHYRELNERSNRLANWMRSLGIQKGDRVSILAHNSVVYVDLFYGLAKIGAILAPLNWRLTANELGYIINDCQPRAIIGGPEFVDVLSQIPLDPGYSVLIGVEGAAIPGSRGYEDGLEQSSPAEPERPALDPDDTYCILYTSGTTGRPKGALIPHRQVLWNCINTIPSWGLTEKDVSPVFTPLFHAGGLFAFLTTLFYVGGRIVLSRTFDLTQTMQAIQDEQCTVVLGVPTTYRMWMNSAGFAGADFSSVRFFISGGAPLDVTMVRSWLKAKGGVFRQGYGLTEVGANCFTMTDQDSVNKIGSVGRPIFHSQMRLVDESGRDVAVGEPGELIIRGPHVCTGYWHNPQATAEAIVDGWFHTGDMARRDEDGFYYIAGRYKDMIKSGGENIYAAEVESVLAEHPAVDQAALIGQPDEKWGEIGLMLVVLKAGCSATADELKSFCGGRLARFKIPKRVVFVDALPYSPYGKVLKTELIRRFVERREGETHAAPQA
jgi:fatty-acyl-CoA synthase